MTDPREHARTTEFAEGTEALERAELVRDRHLEQRRERDQAHLGHEVGTPEHAVTDEVRSGDHEDRGERARGERETRHMVSNRPTRAGSVARNSATYFVATSPVPLCAMVAIVMTIATSTA